jgi:hypothetical protein
LETFAVIPFHWIGIALPAARGKIAAEVDGVFGSEHEVQRHVIKVPDIVSRPNVMFIQEVRKHRWIAARAVFTGWVLWIISLVWLFPFASNYLFIYKVPKPYAVGPLASPDFFGRGLGVSFSLSDPISSAASVLWMPIAAPRQISEHGLADPNTFIFGLVLPFIVAAVCGWVVARFHHEYRRMAVFAFAASMLLVNILLFARHVAIVGMSVAYMFLGPLSLYVAASVGGSLLGGRLVRRKS